MDIFSKLLERLCGLFNLGEGLTSYVALKVYSRSSRLGDLRDLLIDHLLAHLFCAFHNTL